MRSGSSSAARSARPDGARATSSISARARRSTARRPPCARRCGGSASRACPTTRTSTCCGTSSRNAIRRWASSPSVRPFGPTSACATWRRWPSSFSHATSGPATRSGRARRSRQARCPQSWGARPDDLISAGHLISERVMLKNDRFFAVSARDGSMKPAEFAGDGLWSGDTRILSTLRVLVDGVEPTAVGLQADDGSATFELEAAGLHLQRVRFVDEGLHERLTVANRGSTNVDTTLDVEVAADFAAMLGIRGAVPELASPVPAPAVAAVDGIRFARDGHVTRVVPQPHGLTHQLRLEPGEEFILTLDVVPGSGPATLHFDSGLRAAMDIYPRWAAECMSVRTDHPELNELLDQAIADIRLLSNSYDTGIYPTAGLPWFAVPFGRDTLISSTLLLHVNPEIARGVLRYLAKHQGKRVDESSEEQPGKILHEVRSGEVVERGLWPHILYGTIDATPLFLCALTETEHWTYDHRLADELWPAAEAALEWCRTVGDPDGDGYIEHYGGRARNQGWKDSDDSLTSNDGSEVAHPAALCEVQAYLQRGLVGMSRRNRALKKDAARLKRDFNLHVGVPHEKFIAQALDGAKRPVEAVTSNPGHCLWMRVLDRPKAAHVTSRLMSSELFAG